MYICSTCGKGFSEENILIKHFSKCWKEKNPYHRSKEAPRGIDIETREVNDDIANFFKELSNV